MSERGTGSSGSRRRFRRSGSAAVATLGLLVASLGTAGVAGPAGADTPDPAAGTTSGPAAIGVAPKVPSSARLKGAASASTPVHLVVTLKPRDPVALRHAVEAVSTPGSPQYRHYLTPEQFGEQFGATDDQVAQVRAGLVAAGLTPGPTAANHLSIPVDTTAAKASAAFSTPLRAYRTADGRDAIVNTEAPTLPGDVAAHVQNIIGLDTLPVAAPTKAVRTDATVASGRSADSTAPARTSNGVPVACSAAVNTAAALGGANPADLLDAYAASSLVAGGHSGAGQKVAIISLQQLDTTDVNVYRQCFGATGSVQEIPIDGGAVAADGSDEATLDVEAVLGLAPNASIEFYESPNTGAGWYDNLATVFGRNTAKVASVSWGLCEADIYNEPSPHDPTSLMVDDEFNLLAQGALQGQTLFASSGDSGSEGCEADGYDGLVVDDPASQPYATAVGGTSLLTTTAPPQETVWNNDYGASGGGLSYLWLQPPYQTGKVSGADATCDDQGTLCRTVPDVAASADPASNGMILYIGGEWSAYGGTSLGAPVWAALVADMNSSCPATNGFWSLNFTLYGLPSNAFTDVTAGNNDFTGTNGGAFPAKPGYDLATGLGTPVVSNLTSRLCGHTPSNSPTVSFVLAAYTDFTGSLPLDDPSDPLDYWIDRLENHQTTKSAFLATLANSDAWVAHIVEGFYEDTLGRAPDAGGMAYWESVIEQHRMTVAQVAAQFYSSSEYFRRDGNDASTWVADLYDKLLDRAPDSGLDYWVAQVASRGRVWVAYSFYQSSESRRDRVSNLYDQLLHRAPDAGGLAYWAGVIQTRGDIALAENLAASPEYQRLAQTRFPGT